MLDGYKYGTIDSTAYADSYTTVTLESTGDSLTSNLTKVQVGETTAGTSGVAGTSGSSGSSGGEKGAVTIAPFEDDTAVATGDGKVAWTVPALLNTKSLTAAIASVHTWQNGEKTAGVATSDSIDLADEYESELWFGVDCDNADPGDQYTFTLYSIAEAAEVTNGPCAAQITMATPYVPQIMVTLL